MTKEHTSEEIKYRLSDLGVQIGNIAIEYITNLEKENERLKAENSRVKTCSNCDEYVIGRCCNYPNGVCHHWKLSEKYRNDDQLTKVKDILKRLVDLSNSSRSLLGGTWHETVREAEQFLNSEVKK